MQRDERLQQIAREIWENSQKEKKQKKEREELKEEFFRLLDYEFRGKGHLLPVRTIEIPDEFFDKTEMPVANFVKSRFPGWNVEHVERNIATSMTVFVLKRDPDYVAGIVDVPDEDKIVRVTKEIAEYTPEIDWDTLLQERPDLYHKLVKPVVTEELDEQAFEELMKQTPEELATLQRHMKVRQPAIKVVARRVKDDGRETLV